MTGTVQQAQGFRLPDVGEGLTEAEIVAWHVAVGDTVTVNQVLVEIETAKSIVELPSPHAGTVLALLAGIGETVPVGNTIIEIGDPNATSVSGATGVPSASDANGANEANEDAEGAALTPSNADSETPKLLVGYGASDPAQSRRRRRGGGVLTDSIPPSAPSAEKRTDEKPRAKPPVRGLAKQLGVDLTRVAATGANGTISRDDVRRASAGDARAITERSPATAPSHSEESGQSREATRIPIKGVRKATAAAMVTSAFTAPHVTEFVSIDVTASLELLAQVQRRREFTEIKLTPLAFVARAYLRAIARTPMAAAHWDEAAQEIVVPSSVNLGIAAATPRGLLVPNIKGAGSLGLLELATAIGALAATARAGKTPPADLAGGSTTITNIGVFGIDTGTPILNPGETAILAVGAIQRRPWVVGTGDNERIEPRSIMQLALSFDHRVLDGAEGSRLLADTAEILANPALAML